MCEGSCYIRIATLELRREVYRGKENCNAPVRRLLTIGRVQGQA